MIGKVLAITKSASHLACILLTVSLALPQSAWSQTQLATVLGTIADPSGAAIPEARVAIVDQDTGLKREILTGMTGHYQFAGLPIGAMSGSS